jgi:beta-fructofuranosidase
MSYLLYKPDGAWAADFIPFHSRGRFHLYYLHDWRDKAGHGEGTPWYQVSTEDLVHFAEHGEMLPRGREDEQDLYVFTGSVIEGEGHYHIFYTGHNPHLRARGKPEQAVMHAVSDDLLHWHKVPGDTFFAPTDCYEPHDWRDPFVFWNEEAQEYWMLLAARLKTGPSRRRGCTALCASKDLVTWQVREPFYSPGLYYTHECPDLFRMGDWWYLLFSEFSDKCVTRYRMSRSLAGPWLTPDNDAFDNRAFYAAKTAADGRRRFIFGWNPTREPEKDDGGWQWGGNLVVHEVAQELDGTLSVRMPDAVSGAFARPLPLDLKLGLGSCKAAGRSVEIAAPGSFGCATAGPMPACCLITARVEFAPGTRACGLMLRTSDDLEEAYYIRLEPGQRRLVFDMWKRAGDRPFMVELERPLHLLAGQAVEIKVLVDGSVCEVYVGGKVAMSARLYDPRAGNWGVFVQEGMARFEDLCIQGESGVAGQV